MDSTKHPGWEGDYMIHLKSIHLKDSLERTYPFSIPALQKAVSLVFDKPITIFIGENGCGKSTLLDLIASKMGLYRITMDDKIRRENDALFRHASQNVSAEFQLRKPKGFYFSAEDFTSYILSLAKEKEYAREELERVRQEYADRSEFSKTQAATPFAKTLSEIEGMYEKDLLTSSHGEAYLDFFSSRMRKGQLYLLDEPETPLSIQNQLTLVAMIEEAVHNDCQFILATHSPILMGIPEAAIWEFDGDQILPTDFDHIESVRLLRQFLDHREQFFRYLRSEE